MLRSTPAPPQPVLPQGPLASGTLAKVAVLVLSPNRTPVERFVFEPRVRELQWVQF